MIEKFCITRSGQSAKRHNKIIDRWFNHCDKKEIPFISLHRKFSRTNIHHDYISMSKEKDPLFFGENGKVLSKEIKELIYRVANENDDNRMSYSTSGAVTFIYDVPNNIAESVAKELFDLITRHCTNNINDNE